MIFRFGISGPLLFNDSLLGAYPVSFLSDVFSVLSRGIRISTKGGQATCGGQASYGSQATNFHSSCVSTILTINESSGNSVSSAGQACSSGTMCPLTLSSILKRVSKAEVIQFFGFDITFSISPPSNSSANQWGARISQIRTLTNFQRKLEASTTVDNANRM
jgi:hypothetical protein